MNETPISQAAAEAGPTTTETLLGGKTVPVSFRNGWTNQVADQVFVRQIDVDECLKMLDVLDNECGQIELVCNRPAGWAKQLSFESHTALIMESDRINADFFAQWLQRRMARQERMQPGVTQRIIAEATAKLVDRALQNGSPKPPSS